MNFLELVKKRQSVRKYSDKSVPKDVLERCLEAARLAPSACNSQPWSFIVIDDAKYNNEVAEAAFSGIYSSNSFAKSAPVLVVVITEHSKFLAALGGYFRGTQYNLIDIGISAEHFVLQAAEEGLGTCWLGFFNEKAVKKILNIPKDKKVDIIISVGYPADDKIREKSRNPIDEIRKYA
ncbi:MAG: nitroreductase family protein [Elusimicrobiota bacterium]|nr:nitroreductase family protein [Elusimicrobiota bacterium]